ncbi:hypothetical protein EB796_021124 [Bugula neritina]|uniref:Uncharacterized protein n=1 Tax=Bugula neritina TaxID=10212 RepID=A0A7J7J563_BUGNE|nr:hypothetical protein EB796_021124 [Bugula neritina]
MADREEAGPPQLDSEKESLNKPADKVTDVEHVEDSVDTSCGYTATCKPKFLQRLANPTVYLVVISICSIMQGFAVNGINNVNISSYERRYLLSSRNSGLVASFYDIAAGITVLFVGYFGGTGHQPRFLGVGVASLGLGCFIMSMAHFTSPMYVPDGAKGLACDIEGSSSGANCAGSEDDAFLKNYLYVLLLDKL